MINNRLIYIAIVSGLRLITMRQRIVYRNTSCHISNHGNTSNNNTLNKRQNRTMICYYSAKLEHSIGSIGGTLNQDTFIHLVTENKQSIYIVKLLYSKCNEPIDKLDGNGNPYDLCKLSQPEHTDRIASRRCFSVAHDELHQSTF